jgi:hypothetical protein
LVKLAHRFLGVEMVPNLIGTGLIENH